VSDYVHLERIECQRWVTARAETQVEQRVSHEIAMLAEENHNALGLIL
jgi:hypothetical protein